MFGASVAGVGDCDRDGYTDVAVGARIGTDDQSEEGIVYIYRGSSAGLSLTPSWFASGDKAETGFGSSVAGVGDVDLNGYPEILIGAPDYRIATTITGRVFLYEGQVVQEYPYRLFLPQILMDEAAR